MTETIFKGLFDTEFSKLISVGDFIMCIGASLIAGIIVMLGYLFRCKTTGKRFTDSFLFSLTFLPPVVCAVIMMVNGNIGTGVAVAGAFSLVRFRSVPGSAEEIILLFLAMSAGIVSGMGYLGYSVLFALLMTACVIIYTLITKTGKQNNSRHKTLSITIPEDLNYTSVFDDIFEEYLKEYELTRVKTTNMGSLFRVTYNVTLKDAGKEKEMIDRIRCRNGNLEVSVSNQENTVIEL